MLKVLAFSIAATAISSAFAADLAAPSRSVEAPADLISTGSAVPEFYPGYAASFRSGCVTIPCTISVFAPATGRRISVDLSGTSKGTVSIYDFAASTAGVLAISIRTADAGDPVPEIKIFDGSGKPIGSIKTGRYVAAKIAFDPAGDLWALGGVDSLGRTEPQDYDALRKFSVPGGRLLASYLPRNTFHSAQEPGIGLGARGNSQLMVSSSKIAIYNAPTEEWIQMSPEGGQLRRNVIENASAELAPRKFVMTTSGRVFVAKNGPGVLYAFDPDSLRYSEVASSSAGLLVGVDGEQLVFARMSPNSGPGTFDWRHIN